MRFIGLYYILVTQISKDKKTFFVIGVNSGRHYSETSKTDTPELQKSFQSESIYIYILLIFTPEQRTPPNSGQTPRSPCVRYMKVLLHYIFAIIFAKEIYIFDFDFLQRIMQHSSITFKSVNNFSWFIFQVSRRNILTRQMINYSSIWLDIVLCLFD